MVYQFRDHNLRRYQFKAWTYINQREADFFERNRLAQQLDRYPAISIQHILTNDIPNHLKLERILRLFKRSHNLFGILGAVGSGKTALAYVLLKEVSCYKKVYWVGNMKKEKVPPFATHIHINAEILKHMERAEKNIFDLFDADSVIYFDEISHLFPKGALSQENLERLTIYRHKNLVILGSTQNSSIISVDLLRFFTGIFILQTTFFHTENERDNSLIESLSMFTPRRFGDCVFYSAILQNEFFLSFNYKLPEEYDKVAGRSFA